MSAAASIDAPIHGLEEIARNYKVFVDTCTLLSDGCEETLGPLSKSLAQNKSVIILPRSVYAELQKLAHVPDKADRVRKSIHFIKNLQDNCCLRIQGDEDEIFADNVFLAVFTKFRLKHNLCLITQDSKLSADILALEQDRSVKSSKRIRVLRIDRQEGTESFYLRDFTARYAPRTSLRGNSTAPAEHEMFGLAKSIIGARPIPLHVQSLPSEGDVVLDSSGKPHKLGKEIACGGEGSIYHFEPGLVAKVYKKDKLTDHKHDKLRLLISRPINKKGICWPQSILSNSYGDFIGYIMPEARGKPLQLSVFTKPLLLSSFPNWNRQSIVELAINVLDHISYLHDRNVILGDINPLNVLVHSSDEVYLVDTDSFQVEGFPCPVGTVNFTPPEIQGKDFRTFLRTPEHESFAVSTLLFMILLPGKPPYSHQGGGNPNENILKKEFPYPLGSESTGTAPPGPWAFIWSHMTYKAKKAFYDAFKEGKRPTDSEWKATLDDYLYHLKEGHHSQELYPTDFKLVEPVDVTCSSCHKRFQASGAKVKEFEERGKSLNCPQCMQKVPTTCVRCGASTFIPKFILEDSSKRGSSSALCSSCRSAGNDRKHASAALNKGSSSGSHSPSASVRRAGRTAAASPSPYSTPQVNAAKPQSTQQTKQSFLDALVKWLTGGN